MHLSQLRGTCREGFRFYEESLSRKISMIFRKLNTLGDQQCLLQGRMTVLTGSILSVLMLALGLAAGSVVAPVRIAKAAGGADQGAGPTAESALSAEDELTRAMRDNDADGIARSLSDDWAVISARGGVGEGKTIFPGAIKAGYLTHKAYETSESRVRFYGNVALVTTKAHNPGISGGKPFDVMERETDVWLWKDGGWKCVRTHEAWEGPERDQRELNPLTLGLCSGLNQRAKKRV
jgi:ketosteroid isomerase-like protein